MKPHLQTRTLALALIVFALFALVTIAQAQSTAGDAVPENEVVLTNLYPPT